MSKMILIEEAKLKQALEAAYLEGFNDSAEGYNGEYPFLDEGESPLKDRHWIERRDAYVRTAIHATELREQAEFDAAHEVLEKQAGIHVSQQSAIEQAQALRKLADRFSEGWHDGIKIDASDIMLLAMAASAIEAAEKQEPVVTVRTWHKNGDQHAELADWERGLFKLPDGEHTLYTTPPAAPYRAVKTVHEGKPVYVSEPAAPVQDDTDATIIQYHEETINRLQAELAAGRERYNALLEDYHAVLETLEEMQAAVTAEREACAKVCEDIYNDPNGNNGYDCYYTRPYLECANAIRRRGQA